MGKTVHTKKPLSASLLNRLFWLGSYRGRATQAWLALITCLLATALITLQFVKRERVTTRQAFTARTKAVEQAFIERIGTYVQVLRGGGGLFATGHSIGPVQWRAYFESLDLSNQFDGIQALGYIANVPAGKAPEFEAAVRETAQGKAEFASYAIWPRTSQGSHYVVRLAEPLDRNLRALGYDLSSEGVRLRTAEAARDAAQATFTSRISLIQAPEREGVLLLLPVYTGGRAPDSMAERRLSLQGWVYAAFLVENMLAGLVQIAGEGVGLDIYQEQGSENSLLFRDFGTRLQSSAASPRSGSPRREVKIVCGGRAWLLRFYALPGFDQGGSRWVPYSIAAGGSSLSLLVFFIALSLVTSEKRALALSLEMTGRLRLQEKAIASYRELVNNLTVGVYRTTPGDQGQFVEVNPALVAMAEAASREDLLRRAVCELYVDPGQRRHFSEIMLCNGNVKAQEYEMVTLKGRRFWASMSAIRVKDEQGRIFFDGVIEDITERKRAEQALRQTEERLALALQGASDGIWDWNLLTDDVYFSPRWKGMLGYEEHEIENRFSGWERLLHSEDRERALACLIAYLNNEIPTYEHEHRLRHKNGSYRWVLARGVAVRDAQGKPLRMAGSQLDLTERKETEQRLSRTNHELALSQASLHTALERVRSSHEELKSAQLQLIQAAKLESIGTLAAGVAHEVKNPLQTILWGLEYLDGSLRSADRDPNVSTALKDMRDAVQRANSIVRELLQLSAMTALEMKEENVNELLNRALWLSNYEAQASRIEVVKEFQATLPPVPLDRGKMEQAFINVLLNSIQAMPQGGTLSVRTRAHALQTSTGPEPVVLVEFSDTGPGIPLEVLPRIFDPFFTTKPVGVGTGLGLPIIKKIVDLHQGGLSVGNRHEGGITVTFTLRVKKPTPSRSGADGSGDAQRSSATSLAPTAGGPDRQTPSSICLSTAPPGGEEALDSNPGYSTPSGTNTKGAYANTT